MYIFRNSFIFLANKKKKNKTTKDEKKQRRLEEEKVLGGQITSLALERK